MIKLKNPATFESDELAMALMGGMHGVMNLMEDIGFIMEESGF